MTSTHSFLPLKDEIISEQERADADARVSHVEIRPVVLTGVQGDEIYDISEAYPIGQVSQYARQHQRACAEYPIIISWSVEEIVEDRHRCNDSETHKKPTTQGAGSLQLAKSDAGIFRVDQIEEAGNDSRSSRWRRVRTAHALVA